MLSFGCFSLCGEASKNYELIIILFSDRCGGKGVLRVEMYIRFWSENPKERDHSEDLGVDGNIIVQRVLGKYVGRCGLDVAGSGQGPMAGSCEHCNETSGFVKGGEFLD
jgi:hypothetical protein